MSTIYDITEQCILAGGKNDAGSFAFLLDALRSSDWRARYAAATALYDRPAAEAIAPLVEVLDDEDAAPLFGQPEEFGGIPAGANTPYQITFPEGATEYEIEAWRRRGRVKQAAIWTLGRIGAADPHVLARLHRYAVDQAEDYMVRAAANKALGLIADPSSLPVVRQAMGDQETCTVMEATRAYRSAGGTPAP